MRSDTVLDGDPRFYRSLLQQRVIRRATLGLAVVMRTTAAWNEAQAIERTQAAGPRIGDALVEPADGARTDARQHGP